VVDQGMYQFSPYFTFEYSYLYLYFRPGAYTIKSTLGKTIESHIRTPSQYSIRGRTKFGDPYGKAISKTAANEPG
jgi:hypothetical protein